MNDNKFEKLDPRRTYFLRKETRHGHIEGSDWVLDGTVPEGTQVRLTTETNAGFRGLEWSCETVGAQSGPSHLRRGIRLHGVSVCDLSAEEVRCSVCGHPVILTSDHTPERHRRVGIVDNRGVDPQDVAEDLVLELVENTVGTYGAAFAKRVLVRVRSELQGTLKYGWDDIMEMIGEE